MAVVVPFGQYIPGTSHVHTLDVRMKLLLITCYVFALFASGWLGLLICVALLIAVYAGAKIPLRRAARGLKPVILILVFTLIVNAFTFTALGSEESPYDTLTFFGATCYLPHAVPLIGSFGVVPTGVLRGVYFALRIISLVSVATLLTFTSSIVALTDAISSLLSPLRFLRVPVEDVAMMLTIALRFIPLTAAEVEKIMVAQASRGVRFNRGGPLARVKAYVPVMVPLFVNLFKRADELAAAMETRCYVGAGRTRLNTTRISSRDVAIGLIGAVLLISLGVIGLL